MNASENLNLSYILPAQAQKHVTHNDALQTLDALVHLSFKSMQLTVPPSNPVVGSRYFVPDAATDAWSGKDGSIAAFQDGAWHFYTPTVGWIAFDEDTAWTYLYSAGSWIEVPGPLVQQNIELIGVATSADENNPLAVSGTGSLFTHDGAGHRITINKQSEADTASQLFQTNWSGRAEIGLTGDDNLHVKVSRMARRGLKQFGWIGPPAMWVSTRSQQND